MNFHDQMLKAGGSIDKVGERDIAADVKSKAPALQQEGGQVFVLFQKSSDPASVYRYRKATLSFRPDRF